MPRHFSAAAPRTAPRTAHRTAQSTVLSAVLGTCLAATPALADLTPTDAWDIWKAQFQAFGLSLEASETSDGEALQIGDITLSVQFPEQAGFFRLGFTGPRFVPAGDGGVEVHFPETSSVRVSAEIKGEGGFSASGEMTGDSTPGIMTGDPDNATTAWASDGFTFHIRDLAVDGAEGADVTGKIEMGPFTVTNTTVISDSHVALTSESGFDSYDLGYGATVTEGTDTVRIEAGGTAGQVKAESSLVLPRGGLDPLGLHAQLRDGLRLSGHSSVAESRSYQRVSVDGRQISSQNTSGAGYDVALGLDEAGLSYGGTAGAFDVDMVLPELPLPIGFSGQGAEARVLIPLLKSDAVQKAAISIALNGVSLSDQIWALFDPEAKLPRDPMVMAYDLSADARLFFDFLDIRAMMGGAKPIGLPVAADRVALNKLHVAAAGAEVTGAGDFALDFNDMTTFDGLPAPEGKASFTITGSNALIDTLVGMGALSKDDALGARMMMSMFAKPGAAEDVLISDIEVKKTGEILANGQRLR